LIYTSTDALHTIGRRISLSAGALLITIAWIGNVAGPPPSNPKRAPLSSLMFFGLIAVWAYWLDRRSLDQVNSLTRFQHRFTVGSWHSKPLKAPYDKHG
jgi:hypothetical protein